MGEQELYCSVIGVQLVEMAPVSKDESWVQRIPAQSWS